MAWRMGTGTELQMTFTKLCLCKYMDMHVCTQIVCVCTGGQRSWAIREGGKGEIEQDSSLLRIKEKGFSLGFPGNLGESCAFPGHMLVTWVLLSGWVSSLGALRAGGPMELKWGLLWSSRELIGFDELKAWCFDWLGADNVYKWKCWEFTSSSSF